MDNTSHAMDTSPDFDSVLHPTERTDGDPNYWDSLLVIDGTYLHEDISTTENTDLTFDINLAAQQ